jgi:pilus assembly protein Flp/PilA
MLECYVNTMKALKRLRLDQAGVVSFEYIMLATCIIVAVSGVFLSTGGTGLEAPLNAGLAIITNAFN